MTEFSEQLQQNAQELEAICKQLTVRELEWLSIRVRSDTNAEACRNLKIAPSTIYRFPHKTLVDHAIHLIREDGVTVAHERLRRYTGEAVDTLVKWMRRGKQEVSLSATKDLLDRAGVDAPKEVKISGEVDIFLTFDDGPDSSTASA